MVSSDEKFHSCIMCGDTGEQEFTFVLINSFGVVEILLIEIHFSEERLLCKEVTYFVCMCRMQKSTNWIIPATSTT